MNSSQQSELDLLASARVARLATTRPSGKPHIVPITFVVDGRLILSMIDHKPKSTSRLTRLDNIAANPDVSVLVDHYDERWTELWWVRADGIATLHQEGAVWQLAQTRLTEKYEQYASRPPTGPLIAIEVKKLTSWQW